MSARLRSRELTWAVALVTLLSATWVVARTDTAGAGVPPGDGIAVVYVTVGTNYADALGVGPGAGSDSAPIIILPTDPPIPGASAAELARLDPRTVVIIGGTSAISDAMETALQDLLPNAALSRIAGNNRYETNAAFSAANFPIEGWASISAPGFTTPAPATDPGFMTTYATASTGFLYATIQLPHGAEILELVAGVYDELDPGFVYVSLYAVDIFGGGYLVADVSSTNEFIGGYTALSETTIDAPEVVDNETYAYTVFVTGANSISERIMTVRVRYRLGPSSG